MELAGGDKLRSRSNGGSKRELPSPKDGPGVPIAAHIFTFRELAAATENFRPESFLGEGGFGRVYKGQLGSTGQVILSLLQCFHKMLKAYEYTLAAIIKHQLIPQFTTSRSLCLFWSNLVSVLYSERNS